MKLMLTSAQKRIWNTGKHLCRLTSRLFFFLRSFFKFTLSVHKKITVQVAANCQRWRD